MTYLRLNKTNAAELMTAADSALETLDQARAARREADKAYYSYCDKWSSEKDAEREAELKAALKSASEAYDAANDNAQSACEHAVQALLAHQSRELTDAYDKILDGIESTKAFRTIATPPAVQYDVLTKLDGAVLATGDDLETVASVPAFAVQRPEIIYSLGYTDDTDDADELYVVRWDMPSYDGRPATGEELKTMRQRAGLTIAELARRAGLTFDAVHKLESGQRSIANSSAQTVGRIAQVLGVDIRYLIAIN